MADGDAARDGGRHRLTRRDVLAALAAMGGGTAGAAAALSAAAPENPDGDGLSTGGRTDALTAHDRRTLRALARTLYPSAVTNVDAFVDTYVDGVVADSPDRAAAMADAVADLDDHARAWHDHDLADLADGTRDEALRTFGLLDAEPVPDGTRVERVRHYLVDELLLALYASPTGGDLVGLENPPGHPGGLGSYRRGVDGE